MLTGKKNRENQEKRNQIARLPIKLKECSIAIFWILGLNYKEKKKGTQ